MNIETARAELHAWKEALAANEQKMFDLNTKLEIAKSNEMLINNFINSLDQIIRSDDAVV